MKPLSITLFICGLVHCAPVIGTLGPNWLTKLYGITEMSQNVTILMQHRALMFGLMGILFIYATFKPQLQIFASVLAIISMLGFILLVGFDNPQEKLHKVVLIDTVLLVLLAASLCWEWLNYPSYSR